MRMSSAMALLCLAAGLLHCGLCSADRLRPGDKLEGNRFETWLDIPFDSEAQARDWLRRNPGTTGASMVPTEGGVVLRIPRAVEDLYRYGTGGATGLLKTEKQENGFVEGWTLSTAFDTREALAEAIRKGDPKSLHVTCRARRYTEFTPVGEVLERQGYFYTRVNYRVDLLDPARRRLRHEAIGMRYLPQQLSADIELLKRRRPPGARAIPFSDPSSQACSQKSGVSARGGSAGAESHRHSRDEQRHKALRQRRFGVPAA